MEFWNHDWYSVATTVVELLITKFIFSVWVESLTSYSLPCVLILHCNFAASSDVAFNNEGVCAMCGKQVLDTKLYKQSNL